MSTFYLDYENGSDSNSGADWANAWKTITSGATAARIAPGDTIRIAKSPDPTSIGTAKWTNTPNAAGGLNTGTKTVIGASNASPIEITANGHGYSTGDVIYIYGVAGNTAANGIWIITNTGTNTFTLDGSVGNGAWASGGTQRARQINSDCVILDTPVTQTLALCHNTNGWTAGSDVNISTETYNKRYYSSCFYMYCTSSCTTARQLAKYAIPSSLDLSAYQQISLCIMGAIVSAGLLEIRLYSDSACTSLLDTIAFPQLTISGAWYQITFDKGSAMSNGVQGMAICSTGNAASKGWTLSTIIACKAPGSADSLSLTSLIGKSSSATNGEFYPISGIDGKIIMLDYHEDGGARFLLGRGYCGTTESVTTYKRETIKTDMVSVAATVVQDVQEGGTAGSNIVFEGGYNTSTSTRDGLTLFDGMTNYGYGLRINALSYVELKYLMFVRYNYGISISSTCTALALTSVGVVSCNRGINIAAGQNMALSLTGITASVIGIYMAGSNIDIQDGVICGAGTGAISLVDSINNTFKDITMFNNVYGFSFATSGSAKIIGCETGYGTNAIKTSKTSDIFMRDCILGESSEVSFTENNSDVKVFSHNHDDTAGNHFIFTDYGYIQAVSSTREGGSGLEWRMYITDSARASVYPLKFTVAKVACGADDQVTVKAYVKKSHASDIAASLVCPGGQIAGVSSDVTDTKASDTDWEELQIQFTPTEAGVVEIEVWAWWVANTADEYITVEDMTITQA